MSETINLIASVFSKVSLVESAVFMIYCLIGSSVFFLIKIWFPQYLKNKQIESERDLKKTEVIETTLHNMGILLQSNTDAISSFNKAILTLDTTLEKVSDKLYAHDAGLQSLIENIKALTIEVNRLKEHNPGIADVNRIHQRIDELKNNAGDKKDVGLIIHKLDQILEVVLEIKGKIL